MSAPRARLLAYYLPQFYPIEENDRWWGKGFTEWTSVAEARPLFRGHRQPRIPADLGFYDLRLAETRAAQAEMATAHGIEGFCYWHYWFGGKRLLDRPFAEVLGSGEPDFPFCLAWANQAWTDTWLGSGRVLQEQPYSPEDDVAHARWLTEAFGDRRYVTVGGRPLFLVYKPLDLPEPARTADTIRAEAVRAGLAEPLVLGIDAHAFGHDFRADGLDGTVQFEPSLGLLPRAGAVSARERLARTVDRAARNARLGVWHPARNVHTYRSLVELTEQRRAARSHPGYPGVFVGWDNTPRRGERAVVLLNERPDEFADRLARLVGGGADRDPQERLIFVNAWNDWAEGNHLEPDLDTGLTKLEAVKAVVLPGPTG